MSDPVQLALVTSIAPTLAALAAMIIGIRNSRKADSIITKADEIHTLTNSNLTKVTNALAVAQEKIDGLQKLVTTMLDAKAVADKKLS
jgi:hypothetical protein